MRTYIPALDSLRGIAVLLVLGFHYGILDFGWMGVQVFFVLSGYLITKILLEERGIPLRTYIRSFYLRRSLRIFPLYFFFLLALTATYLMSGWPQLFDQYWLTMYTYTLNWVEPQRVLQLPDGRNDPFYHLWSLSIEEQFYLVWPWLVFFLSRRWFKLCIFCLIVMVPILRMVVFERVLSATGNTEYAASILYYLTPFQLDSFAFGALAALVPQPSLFTSRLCATVGIVVLIAGGYFNLIALRAQDIFEYPLSFGYPPHMAHNAQYIWGYSLINAVSACAILYLSSMHKAKGIFAWAPLVRVGKVSYGMYVFHVPVLIAFSTWLIDLNAAPPLYLAGLVLYCALVWLCAEISFRFLETPFLKLKERY